MHNMLNVAKYGFLMSVWLYYKRSFGSINITLRHLLFEVTGKRLGKEKVLFNCFNRS